jgi:hypothetical protein
MDRMAGTSDLRHAIDLALGGDWDGAHAIAQRNETDELFCWLHACLHKMQGDDGNSRYWYAKASRRFDAFADPKEELEAIRSALT